MSSRELSFNPYRVLGVEQSASQADIRKAFRERLADDPGSSMRYRHAYGILKNPEFRRKLDQDLEQQIWDSFEPQPEAPEEPKKARRRSFFRFTRPRLLVLGVLMAGLAVTSYVSFVHESGILCPSCHHASVRTIASTGTSTTLRCTRDGCAFTYVYDETLDAE